MSSTQRWVSKILTREIHRFSISFGAHRFTTSERSKKKKKPTEKYRPEHSGSKLNTIVHTRNIFQIRMPLIFDSIVETARPGLLVMEFEHP